MSSRFDKIFGSIENNNIDVDFVVSISSFISRVSSSIGAEANVRDFRYSDVVTGGKIESGWSYNSYWSNIHFDGIVSEHDAIIISRASITDDDNTLKKFNLFIKCIRASFNNVIVLSGYGVCKVCKSERHLSDYASGMCDSCKKNKEIEEQVSKKAGYVYVLEAIGFGFCKIGRTSNLLQRTSAITIKMPFETRLHSHADTNDPVSHESKLHSIFRHKRVNGEWFSVSANDVDSAMESIGLNVVRDAEEPQ